MLSMSLHHHHTPAFGQYSPSNTLQYESPSYATQHHAQHMGGVGLEELGHHTSPAYALHYPQQQLHHHHQQQQQQRQVLAGKNFAKLHQQQRHHPYAQGPLAVAPRSHRDAMAQDRRSGSSAPVRRRISRACDQCNQLRTKCDGKQPCAHCQEFNLHCEYIRERKKRGKASRKDIQAAAAAAAAASGSNDGDSPPASPEGDSAVGNSSIVDHKIADAEGAANHHSSDAELPTPGGPPRNHADGTNSVTDMRRTASLSGIDSPLPTNDTHSHPHSKVDPRLAGVPNGAPMANYNGVQEYHPAMMQEQAMHNGHQVVQNGSIPQYMMHPSNMHGYEADEYSLMSPASQSGPQFLPPQSPMSNFMGPGSVSGSPGWGLGLGASPSNGYYPPMLNTQAMKYPVLAPLLPYLDKSVPTSLACELLETYFQSSSSTFGQPHSPYVLGNILRKKSFMRPTNPRASSPALLASMLWIGAQTSESQYLTKEPQARGRICQRLFEIAIGNLKPLMHSPVGSNMTSPTFTPGAPSVHFGINGFNAPQGTEVGGATGSLDDVITYLHFATVASASEYKAASLRWWTAAWSLAREIHLGKEVDDRERAVNSDEEHMPAGTSEETREERRRTWWLLFTMDRHLALCYNRSLALRESECQDLLQPVDEVIWQANDHYTSETVRLAHQNGAYVPLRGPSLRCTGHSIFGYFLPLMTILGSIVELNQMRQNRLANQTNWDTHVAAIVGHLDEFKQSLIDFEQRFSNLQDGAQNEHHEMQSPSNMSVHSASSRSSETVRQTKLVVAYSTHLMHTLHILLNGKWDPISLLDDNDLWISTPSFVEATGHAVDAASAIRAILDLDPELDFMPFFFGIYLLQGSFLLLLIADKLQGKAAPNIVEACETIVRAHEACVVTLNTEYQRNFRKVMRSALMQVRGLGDPDEQQQRRRETLSLYRWNNGGQGLAL